MARLECGDHFMKYVLFFFNLLIVIIGIALMVVAAAVLCKWSVITDFFQFVPLLDLFSPTVQKVVPWVIMAVGAAMFMVSFMGCCGAINEHDCLVTSYAVFLIVIIILEVMVGVVVYLQRQRIVYDNIDRGASTIGQSSEILAINGFRTDNITEDIKKRIGQDKLDLLNVIFSVQKQLQCCGIYGPLDYSKTKDDNAKLPKSCCRSAVQTECKPNTAYKGCWTKLKDSKSFLLSVGIGFLCVEVITVIFGLCLAHSIKMVNLNY